MNYANIMVSLDLGAAAATRVQLAKSIAMRFEAQLTGVAARQPDYVVISEDVYESSDPLALEEQRTRDALAQARVVFLREAAGYPRTSWRSAIANPVAFLTAQARSSDIVCVGRHAPSDPFPGVMGVSASPLIMQVGRPVLVCPPAAEQLSASRIVVAWKDTVEARRAIWNSLPFLEKADHVILVTIGPNSSDKSVEEMVVYLALHGIAATTRLLPRPELSVAEELLNVITSEQADLIVMGAYGHFRLQEWFFGGVTRDLLLAAPVCCLISH